MSLELDQLKPLALACLAIAGLLLSLFAARDGALLSAVGRRIRGLDRRLKGLFLPARGQRILAGQVAACALSVTLFQLSGRYPFLVVVPAALLGPDLVLLWRERKRRASIEAKADGFALALASALQANPSIGRALAVVAQHAPSPLDNELEFTLGEMRVGSPLERAVSDLGKRIGSAWIDASIAALLIGRRIGGNIPEVLHETAATLRELIRLAALLRAKTADARAQMVVLAVAPVVVVFAFDAAVPGYFLPLIETDLGRLVLSLAGLMWLLALFLAHRILSVKL